jgi:hypothetical protein
MAAGGLPPLIQKPRRREAAIDAKRAARTFQMVVYAFGGNVQQAGYAFGVVMIVEQAQALALPLGEALR